MPPIPWPRRPPLARSKSSTRSPARASSGWCSTTGASSSSSARSLTLALGLAAAFKLTLNASFERMIPQSHPYIVNYLENRNDLRGLGNSLRIVVESTRGDIHDPAYIETLKRIHDEVFLTPGVDRAWVKSLWAPAVRWTEITEEGFRGGPVMPDNYDGSSRANDQLRANIARAGIVGSLVGTDFKSSMLVVPLLDKDPSTGKGIDYRELSHAIDKIIEKAEGESKGGVKVHVIGFAKLVGDLIDGLMQMGLYFGLAALIAAAIIWLYTRCVRSTALVIACSLVAVVWQLGLVAALGFELDPYSILVPFLVFAIGVSHGAQKMNGIMQDIARGAHRLVAARFTFRRLFLAGLTALLADVVGFAVLTVIDIPVIQDLALTASIGVAVLIVTNLILLPVLLSYFGVEPGRGKAQPGRRGRRRGRAAASIASGCGSAASPSRRRALVAIGVRGGADRRRLRREPASSRSATSTRVRPSCAPTRATTATTPTSPATTRSRATPSR